MARQGKSRKKPPAPGHREGAEKIAPDLLPLARPISGLRPHRRNERLHPERNLAAIAAALDVSGYDRLILCGQAVVRSLGLEWEPLATSEHRGIPALLLPHPSRVSRWWNEPSNVTTAKLALRGFMPEAANVLI